MAGIIGGPINCFGLLELFSNIDKASKRSKSSKDENKGDKTTYRSQHCPTARCETARSTDSGTNRHVSDIMTQQQHWNIKYESQHKCEYLLSDSKPVQVHTNLY